jgi:hypothetical protein
MDVCAFVGVAPRGPAREPFFDEPWAPRPCIEGQTVALAVPVAVESWNQYVSFFGAFEGPGLLPYAVASFFENGGRRAYVVRIVHEYFKADGTPDDAKNRAGIGRAKFIGLKAEGGREVWLAARNEGTWGSSLAIKLSFTTSALALGAADFFRTGCAFLRVSSFLPVAPCGSRSALEPGRFAGWRRLSTIGIRVTVLASNGRGSTCRPPLRLIQRSWSRGRLDIDDGVNPTETHEHLGLAANHPRWLAQVIVTESHLLFPCDNPYLGASDPLAYWLNCDLALDPALPVYATAAFWGGADRYADITPADFFDDNWVLGDDCPGSGIHALADLDELSLLIAPDLYSPGPLLPVQIVTAPATLAGPEFSECLPLAPAPPQGAPVLDLTGLRLDPNEDLDAIAALQRRMTDLADQLESFIVLLDVPPGLSQRRMLYWRAKFATAYAAAYHPWLKVARTDDRRGGLVAVNPSGFAAGIIAQREFQFGVPYGPANVIAVGAVEVADAVSPARHDELHQNAINIYLRERDGVLLTAARTLALDQTWRQLNVRRLMTMIRRVLNLQMQWAVFEPNNPQLRFQLSRIVEAYLRQLYRANAFTGTTESQAFFVKCDDKLNPQLVQRQGQVLAQVGIAPAEPLEFIVLNIARDGDFSLMVEES